jgi:predicted DNA-binding transcriptional regulator YafY
MSYGNAAKLLRVATKAAGRMGVTLGEIADMCECDRRTAQRITVALTDLFPETERWTDDDNRPRWRLPTTSIVAFLSPAPEELAVLARAIDKLEHDGAINEARTLRSLEDKVLANIPRGSRARIEVDEEALLQALGLARRPGPRPMPDNEVDDALAIALKGRRHIRMLYSSWGDAEPRWRQVAPHGLLLGTRRYLVAHDVQRGDKILRHYRVEGIAEVEILPESFAPDPGFDLAAHARAGFSSYVNVDEVERVVWRFSADAAERARRFVFHPDQEMIENEDGTITVTFSACGLLEMCWHLYSWGDRVEVIEPERLRAMVEGYRRDDFRALP